MLNANRAGIGTYHRALNFGRILCAAGHSATLYTVSHSKRWQVEFRYDPSGLQIFENPNWLDEILPWHSSGPLDISLRIRAALNGRYDLIYAFEYQPNISLPALAGKYLRGLPLISDWCDWHAGASYHFGGYRWAHAVDRVFEEFIRFRADHVTVINETLKARALSIGLPAKRVSLIREGVDPQYIRHIDRDQARQRLGIPRDAVIVGTIREGLDGLRILAEAVHILSRSKAFETKNIQLLVIGRLPEAFTGVAAQIGISERVILPGRVSDEDLPYYLAAADILALPLEDNLINRGRWPHKLGDYAAAQRPIVVSPGGEFPALLQARQAALIVSRTATAYAAAFEQILASPQDSQNMAERARALMVHDLSWERIAPDLVHLVERVGAKR